MYLKKTKNKKTKKKKKRKAAFRRTIESVEKTAVPTSQGAHHEARRLSPVSVA